MISRAKKSAGWIPITTDQEEPRKTLKTPLLEVFGPHFLQKKHWWKEHDLSEEDPGWVALNNGILMALFIIPVLEGWCMQIIPSGPGSTFITISKTAKGPPGPKGWATETVSWAMRKNPSGWLFGFFGTMNQRFAKINRVGHFSYISYISLRFPDPSRIE